MDFLFQSLDINLDDIHSLNQGHGRLNMAVEPSGASEAHYYNYQLIGNNMWIFYSSH